MADKPANEDPNEIFTNLLKQTGHPTITYEEFSDEMTPTSCKLLLIH